MLGLRVSGDKGRGVKDGKPCLPCGDIRLSYGDVTVDGGESGIEDVGVYVLVYGLTGLDRSGFGNGIFINVCGEGGGDGVDVVERKVGPGPCSAGDSSWSCGYGLVRSIGCDIGRKDARIGCGDAIGGEGNDSRVGEGKFCAAGVGKNCYRQFHVCDTTGCGQRVNSHLDITQSPS